MASYLAFDPNVISQVSLLSKVGEEHYPAIFDAAITSLESSADEKQLSALVESTGAKASIISKIVQACSIMLWDLTKSAPRDPNVISDALQVMGMTKKVTNALANQYAENKARLSNLKGALSVSLRRYKDLEWRLDMEIGRRNVTTMVKPKYQLRLDVFEPQQMENGDNADKLKSFHMQTDYAILRHVHVELERALDEVNSTHGQRVTRYIK